MTLQEKREGQKRLIVTQLRRKVRSHRPAAKVLEIAIALAEERIETLTERKEELEWELDYLKKLDPKELEQEEKS